LWIGLYYTNGNWIWSSGEPVTYTNWVSAEPNNFSGKPASYVALNEAGNSQPGKRADWGTTTPSIPNVVSTRYVVELAGVSPDFDWVTQVGGGISGYQAIDIATDNQHKCVAKWKSSRPFLAHEPVGIYFGNHHQLIRQQYMARSDRFSCSRQ